MALQAETIVAGLVKAWNASPTLTSLVPGGLWFSQAPQEVVGVYGALAVKTDGVLLTSQRDYVQNYTVTVRVFSGEAMTDSSKAAIRNALGSAWCSSTVTFTGATSMGLWPTDATVDMAADRRNAEDVLVSTASFGGMAQGVY